MPKMKSHSATQKRVKKTATGKLKVSRANRSHLKGNKSKKAIRNNRSGGFIGKADEKRIKQQLSQVK